MFRIEVRRQPQPRERWQVIAVGTDEPGKTIRLPDADAAETDLLSFKFVAGADDVPAIRLWVGSVMVASTVAADRVGRIDYDETSDAETPPLVTRGRFLADWVGVTELFADVRIGDDADWTRAFVLPVAVSAGKLGTEQFNQLFEELQRDAAAMLLDIHGKTRIGLEEVRPQEVSPVAVLTRLRATVAELDDVMHQIARNPASRLRTRTTREQALAGQSVSEATVDAATRDAGLLERRGTAVVFREQLREHSRPDYRIPEHRTLADFGAYLKDQLSDLRGRIDAEIADREGRKRWRNHVIEPGKPTWWEAEDLPRIAELHRLRGDLGRLHGVVDAWGGRTFLPPGRPLRQPPPSTPLFRNHALYRRAFRLIAAHFRTYRATLDTSRLPTQARSLPVLYEWWCAVRVVRLLARRLTVLPPDGRASGSLAATHLTAEGRQFTVEFAADQAVSFIDPRGSRVRFRYQPAYRGSEALAPLDAGTVRTPDMALEVYPPDSPDVPELVIVLDAKYSAQSHWDKLTEVGTKYSKIGDTRTGRVLSRQVWALTPAAPATGDGSDGLRRYCTVDNQAFWSADFDPGNPVIGAVQVRPTRGGEYDPLAELVDTLLRQSGIGDSSEPEA